MYILSERSQQDLSEIKRRRWKTLEYKVSGSARLKKKWNCREGCRVFPRVLKKFITDKIIILFFHVGGISSHLCSPTKRDEFSLVDFSIAGHKKAHRVAWSFVVDKRYGNSCTMYINYVKKWKTNKQKINIQSSKSSFSDINWDMLNAIIGFKQKEKQCVYETACLSNNLRHLSIENTSCLSFVIYTPLYYILNMDREITIRSVNSTIFAARQSSSEIVVLFWEFNERYLEADRGNERVRFWISNLSSCLDRGNEGGTVRARKRNDRLPNSYYRTVSILCIFCDFISIDKYCR